METLKNILSVLVGLLAIALVLAAYFGFMVWFSKSFWSAKTEELKKRLREEDERYERRKAQRYDGRYDERRYDDDD